MRKALRVFAVALVFAVCACARLAWALTDPAVRSMLASVWRTEIERNRRA